MADPLAMTELVSIASAVLSAEIDPKGAELHALRDREGRDLLWDGDPTFWSGRAPVLFPVIGVLNGDGYHLDGCRWPMTKHGFARGKRFRVIEAGAAAARFQLLPDDDTRAAYPFDFELVMAFALEGATLTMTAHIANHGARPMPASFGFHPAFRWPLPYGRPRAEHRIRFEHPEPSPIRRIDKTGLLRPAPEPTPVTGHDLMLADALFVDDVVIFDSLNSRRLTYGADAGPRLEIAFPDAACLGVWTKPGAPYICIEPWRGIADPEGFTGDIRDKPGIFEVPPGSETRATICVTLRED